MPQRQSRSSRRRASPTGIANPHLSYTKGDDVAYFFEEEFDVEVLLYVGQKAKATSDAWIAKPGNAAKREAYRKLPENVVTKEAYNKLPENVVKRKAYDKNPSYVMRKEAYNKAYRAKVLVKRLSAARDRLKQDVTSESAERILGEIAAYLESLPDDDHAYIFMSSEDQRSITRERSTNKGKVVTMGGEETTYVEKEWVIVGEDVVTPREEGTGINGVPDDAGYVIARIVEALAVEENSDRVGNQTSGGGGRIPRIEFLRSGRVCVGSVKRSEE